MKWIPLSLAGLVALGSLATLGAVAIESVRPAPVFAEPATLDLGTILMKRYVEQTVSLTNRSGQPVPVLGSDSGCRPMYCAHVKLPERIAAESSYKMPLRFASRRAGPFEHTVPIFFDTPGSPTTVRIKVIGEAVEATSDPRLSGASAKSAGS